MTCCHSTHNYSNFHQSAVLPWEQLSQLSQREKEERFSALTPSVYPLPLTPPFPPSDQSRISSRRSASPSIKLISQPSRPPPPPLGRPTRRKFTAKEGARFIAPHLLFAWRGFYAPFDPDSCQDSPLTLPLEDKKITKHKTKTTHTHTHASELLNRAWWGLITA